MTTSSCLPVSVYEVCRTELPGGEVRTTTAGNVRSFTWRAPNIPGLD
jgi:hypothetical protein